MHHPRRLALVLALVVGASVRPATAQSDLDLHHLSYQDTKVAVKLYPNVQRRTDNTKINEARIPHTYWQSSTSCCSHVVMAMDLKPMFSKGILPDQVSYGKAQTIFDGSVESLISNGGYKVENKKESWNGYPSRKIQIRYKNPRKVVVARLIMIETSTWIFLWQFEEKTEDWKKGFETFFNSIEVM